MGLAMNNLVTQVTKLDAAQRQLDQAIRLLFGGGDMLSVHTLAFASFRILMDIFPHQDDDFGKQIDALIEGMGWKRFTAVANFLKHADRDADHVLKQDLEGPNISTIGFATLLYRRLAGDFTDDMRGFDCWNEILRAPELGIERDPDPAMAAHEDKIRQALLSGSSERRLALGKIVTDELRRIRPQAE